MDITVREQPLPGIGQRYELDLSATRRLVVVATREGGRWMGITDDGADETAMLELSPDQAATVGALLLGARFSIDVSGDPGIDSDTVIVETITVTAGSPAIGQRPSEVLEHSPTEAQVLAVIRDRTPEIVEPDHDALLQAGDHVAVAVRADGIERVRLLLTG